MPHMTDRSCVAAQYADDRNLSIRMKLHAKHSTAQISMNDWLFAQYDLMGPCRILELGCGNAAQWEGEARSASQRFSFGAIGFFSGYGGDRLEKV